MLALERETRRRVAIRIYISSGQLQLSMAHNAHVWPKFSRFPLTSDASVKVSPATSDGCTLRAACPMAGRCGLILRISR